MYRRSEFAHFPVRRTRLMAAKPNPRYHFLSFSAQDFPLPGSHFESVLRKDLSYGIHDFARGIAGKNKVVYPCRDC
jgi:hypothetical protein